MPTEIIPRLFIGNMSDAIAISEAEANAKKPSWSIICLCNPEERIGHCYDLKHDRELVMPILKYSDHHWHLDKTMVDKAVDNVRLLLDTKPARNVLVHCFVGQERSPLIVQKYLVKYKCMDASEAFKMIQEKRPIVIRCDHPDYWW